MRRYGVHVDVDHDGEEKQLDEETLVLTYHSVREFLFNVLKHAGTRTARVVLRNVGDHLEVTVIDEGQGFDPSAKHVPTERGGFGLFSIQERVTLLGGECKIVLVAGKGTGATIVVPLAPRSNAEPHRRTAAGSDRLESAHRLCLTVFACCWRHTR